MINTHTHTNTQTPVCAHRAGCVTQNEVGAVLSLFHVLSSPSTKNPQTAFKEIYLNEANSCFQDQDEMPLCVCVCVCVCVVTGARGGGSSWVRDPPRLLVHGSLRGDAAEGRGSSGPLGVQDVGFHPVTGITPGE